MRYNLQGKIFYYLLLAVAFTMPLQMLANSISIILLVIVWLVEGNFKRKLQILKNNKLIFIFLSFYFIHVFGMFYTKNSEEGWFILQRKLSLLALPLTIGTAQPLLKNQLGNILKAFVISCFCVSVLCMSYGLYYYIINNSYLQPHELTSFMKIDRIYFAIYLSFCILILFWLLKNYWTIYSHQLKIFLFLVAIYFLAYIIFLGAKTDLISTLFLLSFAALFFSFQKGKSMIGISAVILLIAGTVLLSYKADFLKTGFKKIIESDFNASPDGTNGNSLTLRIVKWQCSIKGIRENPVFGTGTGDSQDYLNKCYEQKNFWGQYPSYHFNAHNQYLETTLTVGLLGLLFFLACLIIPFINALKGKQYLFLSFLFLLSVNSLTESFLERQHGVVFYSFFLSIFTFLKKE